MTTYYRLILAKVPEGPSDCKYHGELLDMCEFESDQDMNLFKAIERLHLAGIAEQAFFDHLEKCKQCADAVYDGGLNDLPLCDEGTKLDGAIQ